METSELVCRCGCVPSNMMSLFQMAELRAKRKEEQMQKEKLLKDFIPFFHQHIEYNLQAKLVVINMSKCNITSDMLSNHLRLSDGVKYCSLFTFVHTLALNDNCISDIPDGLFRIMSTSLLHVNLSNNQIKTMPSDSIGLLANVISLRLDYNLLTGLPDDISKCTSLKYLNVSNNDSELISFLSSSRDGNILSSLNKLEKLILSDTDIDNEKDNAYFI